MKNWRQTTIAHDHSIQTINHVVKKGYDYGRMLRVQHVEYMRGV